VLNKAEVFFHMNQMRAVWMVFFVAIAGFFWPGPAISGDVLDFAVIQPGQPGTPQEAQPVMDALAAYIQKKMGPGVTIKGSYFNELDPALDVLHNRRPTWGIVRLGFYSEQAINFQMTALASTRPGGCDKDIWRLVVSRDAPGDWKALHGKVLGNMLFEREAAACLLFGLPSARLPFTLQGTFQPLRSLRNVIRGKAAGAVLDRTQYAAVQALPLAKEIKVIHTSRELPASPVVWFGVPDLRTQGLASILLGMKEDKDAETLLKLLQTDGFAPADPDLAQFRRGENGAVCFP
jgi:hypothetical protein